jgi:hypothetical protein
MLDREPTIIAVQAQAGDMSDLPIMPNSVELPAEPCEEACAARLTAALFSTVRRDLSRAIGDSWGFPPGVPREGFAWQFQ